MCSFFHFAGGRKLTAPPKPVTDANDADDEEDEEEEDDDGGEMDSENDEEDLFGGGNGMGEEFGHIVSHFNKVVFNRLFWPSEPSDGEEDFEEESEDDEMEHETEEALSMPGFKVRWCISFI